jgi:ankyrin repeat protein
MELLKAVQAGNRDAVNALLDQGADPNEPGYEGMTPLIVAAIGGHADVVAALLDRGAEIDRPDDGSQTALVHSIRQRNDDVTDLLLQRGANPALENWLAFYSAVQFGRIPLVLRLLEMGADPNVQDDGPTPLMEAVGRGNFDLVKVLLDAGADPQRTAEEGVTAFDLAVRNRHKEIVELLEKRVAPSKHSLMAAVQARDARMVEKLIARGVPVNFSDDQFGYTPLSWAAENGSTRIARRLIEAGAYVESRDWMKQTPLWTAVMGDHVRVVRVLLEAGAKFDITDHSGDTLLQSAVWSESFRPIELLLAAGADPNTVGPGTPAALHWAVMKGSPEVTDLLLEAGADPNIPLPAGRDKGSFEGLAPGATPLMIAAREGSLELVHRLLEAGADWTQKDSQGKTAVDLATKAGRTEVLRRLEQAGAKVDYTSERLHNAALMESVKQQDVGGVRRALEGGARTNLTEKRTERTPLMLACLDGNAEIVTLLLDAGADPNEHTKRGEYPLANAVVRGHTEVVRLLLAAGAEVDVEYDPRSVPAGQRNCVIPSRFCPLADAVSGGHDDITALLLQAGADLNPVSPYGDSPLLAAVTSRHFALARRLLAAGAEPRPEDADYLDILHWEERAASPSYQQSVDEVRDVAGVEPKPVEFLPGTCSFRFTIPEDARRQEEASDRTEAILNWSKSFNRGYRSLADQVNAVIDELWGRIAERGFHLLDAGMPLGCGPMTRFLVLVPTPDHFAVMAAFGTHGNDDQLSNRDLIAWFREFEKEHPFALRACKYDTIVIELERPLDDPKKWARKLVEFDSDIWHDDLKSFERHLESSTRIHFWWD